MIFAKTKTFDTEIHGDLDQEDQGFNPQPFAIGISPTVVWRSGFDAPEMGFIELWPEIPATSTELTPFIECIISFKTS